MAVDADTDGPDLTHVLRRLTDPRTGTRKTEAARTRLANDDLTRELLDAGLRLLEEEFGYTGDPSGADGREDQDGALEGPSRFFDFLSAARVTAEVHTAGRRMATPAHLRDRWPTHADFVDDLMAYAFSRHHWSMHLAQAERALQLVRGADDLESVAREIAYLNIVTLQRLSTYRLTVVVATVAEGRPDVRTVLTEMYDYLHQRWAALYEQLLQRFDLQLRQGVTLRELTSMLMALAEGLGMRSFALGDAELVDHATHDSLLARAGLRILLSCTEPAPPVPR